MLFKKRLLFVHTALLFSRKKFSNFRCIENIFSNRNTDAVTLPKNSVAERMMMCRYRCLLDQNFSRAMMQTLSS